MFDDTYKTIEFKAEGIFRDKGSKFIAYCFPFEKEDKLKSIIAVLRNQHPKARHFCYAYRLGPDRSVFRFNDDGEPSGTAGRPILNVLLSSDVTNVLIVAVRYFGGTLLGVPGLINAYKMASLEALKNTNIIQKTLNDVYEITFEYIQMNDIMRVFKEEQLSTLQQQFDNQCNITFQVRKAQLNAVIAKFEKVEGAKLKFLYTI